jgi:hypothetical protein
MTTSTFWAVENCFPKWKDWMPTLSKRLIKQAIIICKSGRAKQALSY